VKGRFSLEESDWYREIHRIAGHHLILSSTWLWNKLLWWDPDMQAKVRSAVPKDSSTNLVWGLRYE